MQNHYQTSGFDVDFETVENNYGTNDFDGGFKTVQSNYETWFLTLILKPFKPKMKQVVSDVENHYETRY